MNYVWSEVHGQTEANNFVSCYIDYLSEITRNTPPPPPPPHCSGIIFWSDWCTYQSKCNILATAILSFVVENKVSVQHKYLEVECDSVHSNIENALKKTGKVNLPNDCINIIHSARSKRGPNEVKYLDYQIFKDYNSTCVIKIIKPSKDTGRP